MACLKFNMILVVLTFIAVLQGSAASRDSQLPDHDSPVPATPSYSAPEPVSSSPSYPAIPAVGSSPSVKAAYWPSYGIPPATIETAYFTHIYYAFLLPEPSTYKLNITPSDHKKMSEFVEALRVKTPRVKILLSVGGGGNNATVFSEMASTKVTRAIFIKSTLQVARQYGFDGVDLDWEFPANNEDMSNLAILYEEWSMAFVKEAKLKGKHRLLLTSAVYFSSNFTSYGDIRGYPSAAITKYVDWVSPMCFDYHGSWENLTGLHSALYDSKSDFSSNYGIGTWIKSGVPPNKLVMGLPLYGHTWKLKDPKKHGNGAIAVGKGPGNGDGTMNYNDIVDFNHEKGSRIVYNREAVSYYSYVGDSWIGYDDDHSIKLKVEFARRNKLRGYFFWALGMDVDWSISRTASKTWGHHRH